jgi:hypothetical protein
MTSTRLPTEVELAYEVMSCNAMRTAQEPTGTPHPCTYFRRWGTYHSYDYTIGGAPTEPGIVHEAKYVGRAPLVPELLSGCRKAPILAVGINPNLPGWWAPHRRSLNPLFDDYRQYAHYFRYRAIAKLELSEEDYEAYGGGAHDTPFSGFELQVPRNEAGDRVVSLHPQPQLMYDAYQSLLDSLATSMEWPPDALVVGEDLAYGNMVASPSAKWTTIADPSDPTLPPMSEDERVGIVTECFRERRYFLRQLFQSLPAVVLVFSQSTANAFNQELHDRFSSDRPERGESIASLMQRHVRLRFGDLPNGDELDARVIYSPHITGNPQEFAPARAHVVGQLVEEARAGRLPFNFQTGHLMRPAGACVFCPMLEIGPCDYEAELRPLIDEPTLTADSPIASLLAEKAVAEQMLDGVVESAPPVATAWANTDEIDEPAPEEA